MTSSNHGSEPLQHQAPNHGSRLKHGVVNGLLIAIPSWVLIGAVLVLVFQEGPMSESASLAFMIAAVIEAVLAGYALRSLWPALWRRGVAAPSAAKPEGRPARVQTVQRSILRQTASFAALVIAFLHYYFWDVSLQIASLQSVTVFVAVTPLQKFAT